MNGNKLNYLAFPSVTGQNPWLDALRTIAITLVLARHGERALVNADPTAESIAHTLFMNGWIGVDLFFVLSGYLITAHLLRSIAKGGQFNLRHYLAKRALRILPAYYAVLILVVLGVFHSTFLMMIT